MQPPPRDRRYVTVRDHIVNERPRSTPAQRSALANLLAQAKTAKLVMVEADVHAHNCTEAVLRGDVEEAIVQAEKYRDLQARVTRLLNDED